MLIVFSGLDGAGKSTQIELLREAFRAQGRPFRQIWTRGGYTPGFEGLKNLFRREKRTYKGTGGQGSEKSTRYSPQKWKRQVWLTLAMLDLCRIYGLKLRWWLWRGETVIGDRYLWDTLVDFRTNFPQEKPDQWLLWKLLAWLTPKPDVAFLLIIPPQESLRRTGGVSPEWEEIFTRRLFEYQRLASRGYWFVLDGKRPPLVISEEIQRRVFDPSSDEPDTVSSLAQPASGE